MLKNNNIKILLNFENISILFRDAERKGFFHLLTANFIIGFLGYGSQLLVSKFLTPIELGQIKTMQSFIGVATILAGFGFNTAVLKLCSEQRPTDERAYIFRQSFYYSSISLTIVLLTFFLLAKSGYLSPDATINKCLQLYILTIPAAIVTSLIMVYLQALKKIRLMAKVQIIIRLIGFLILVSVTYFYGLIGFIISTILISYVALIPLLKLVKNDFGSKIENIYPLSQSFFYAKWSVAANAIFAIGQYMDIFMLNYLTKDREGLGYYGIATILIVGLSYITTSVQSIATPFFSEKSNDKSEFLRVLQKYTKLLILLSLGISIIAFAIIPTFIENFYGNNYESVGTYFRILLLQYFFWSCSALPGVAILGMGKMKYNFLSVSITLPIALVLSFFFIKFYGITGAAIAQALAYFTRMIIVFFMIQHLTKRQLVTIR